MPKQPWPLLLRWRRWRGQRPTAAGVTTSAAGLAILIPPSASLQFREITITLQTLGGASAVVIGIAMFACAAGMMLQPATRTIAGCTTFVLALAAFIAANLGSMLIGTTLGILGAAFALSWKPPTPDTSEDDEAADTNEYSFSSANTDAATDPRLAPLTAAAGNHGREQ